MQVYSIVKLRKKRVLPQEVMDVFPACFHVILNYKIFRFISDFYHVSLLLTFIRLFFENLNPFLDVYLRQHGGLRILCHE
jgi:hypothetical protein